MAALVYDVTVIALTEFLSCIWLEALMFSFATITYLAISGGIRTKKCQHGKIQALSPGHSAKRAIAKGAGSQPQLGWGDLGPFFASLRKGNLEDAVKLLLQLPAEQLKAVRSKAFPRLLATAAAAVDVNAAAAIVHGAIGPIEPQMLEIAVLEAQKCGNARLCGQLDGLALLLSVPKSQITLTALARSYTGDDEALKTLLHQTSAPLTNAFAKALLQACAATKHVELVAEIFDRVDPVDAALLRSYAEQVATCAMSADQVQTSIVQACISCSDWNTAKQQILDARQNGVPVARANIAALIKSLLAADKLSFAGMLLKDSSDLSLQVSQASYHGMLHAHVIAGDHIAAWRLVADMRDAGFPPNQVSCSILLKLVSSQARAVDLSKVINLVNNMEVPADDVLLCSLTEACVRAGCWDLLSHITALPSGSSGNSTVRTLPVPLYGTMIKALGQAGEVDRVWALWGEMWSSGVEPTEITLGCMIESLVSNSETDAAWRLVQEIWQNEGRRHLVNTVTYSTLLKGFSAQPQKVEAMYMEMKERKIECNTITYNTILNHFAQSRAMRRVPQVLEDMRASTPPVEPDIVTYSRSFGVGTPSHLIGAMKADGAALLAAAVRAAVLAKAPRRTVQAVASAVTGVLARPETANAAKGPGPSVPAGSQSAAAESAGELSPEVLLESLKAARSARRRRKKERRKARKEATRPAAPETGAGSRELVPVSRGSVEPVPADANNEETGTTGLTRPLPGAPPVKKLRGGGTSQADDALSDLNDGCTSAAESWVDTRTEEEIAQGVEDRRAETLLILAGLQMTQAAPQQSQPKPRQDRQRKGRGGAKRL